MIWCFKGFLQEAFDFLFNLNDYERMSDISIIDESLAWIIIAVLGSAAISFFIFVYHVILAYIKSNREKIRFKDTRSYGYVVGGGVFIGFEFFCLLLFLIKNEKVQSIVSIVFSVVLFFSPAIIGLMGYFYNRSKKL